MKYYITEWGEGPDDAEEFDTRGNKVEDAEDVELWLGKIAAHVHSNRDGWESTWPLDAVAIDNLGKRHECVLSMEIVPHFSGSVKS